MRLAEIRVLFDYNSWATRRILSVARALSAEQYAASSDFPCGSLRDTLLHTLSAERNWLARWQEQEAPPELTAEEFPALVDLTEQWRIDEGRLHAYLATLIDADLDQRINYTLGDGTPAADWRWTMMAQMINHGTQHRTEAAQLLTDHGHSPGNLDLLIFLHLHEF